MSLQPLIYAGIGSRQTPPNVITYMMRIAGRLAKLGYLLRSGAAAGADTSFAVGCDAVQGKSEIWLPWPGFNGLSDTGFYPTDEHARIAASVHPAWDRLSRGPRALHSRNIGQILGRTLKEPVSFVLCFTDDGCEAEETRTPSTGGTATAIVLASRLNIPVFNLANADAKDRLALHVLADCRKFHQDGTLPESGEVLVFGGNAAGIHGLGAAKVAVEQFGAIRGCGQGLQGNSYSILTKGKNLEILSLDEVRANIDQFIHDAKTSPDRSFFLTRVGCVLARNNDADIAPLFASAPLNCSFPDTWKPWLARKPSAGLTTEILPVRNPTRVVHVREQPYDVYIGRRMGDLPESVWHNPFQIGKDGTREDVVASYADYLPSRPDLMDQINSLRGKVLGCWCKSRENPDLLCHGDVLAALADGRLWTAPAKAQHDLF